MMQVNKTLNSVHSSHCTFHIIFTTNSVYFHKQYELVFRYNAGTLCCVRGKNGIFNIIQPDVCM
jgi:hypothetical protein